MKNKIVAGLVFGILLGALDGATAWFTPEVRDAIGGIIFGAAFKGMVVGLLCGWFARRKHSTAQGVALGTGLGLLFAFAIAAMQPQHYYLQLMVPGGLVGLILGYLTQTMGAASAVNK